MGFLFVDGSATPFGFVVMFWLFVSAITLVTSLLIGVGAWIWQRREHSAKRIENFTLLEIDYQIMKLQEDPHWCESPIDVAKDKGFAMAKAKIQANLRAREQLFGNQFEVINAESRVQPGIRV